jgi:hypothetical protein
LRLLVSRVAGPRVSGRLGRVQVREAWMGREREAWTENTLERKTKLKRVTAARSGQLGLVRTDL